MLKNFVIAATLLAAAVSAAPAQAQSIEIGPNGVRLIEPETERPPLRREGVSERRAARIARRQGMEEIDSIARRRNVYVVRGVDANDDDMKVVIDRYTGDVLEID